MTTGLPITEINKLLAEGATIEEDGTIKVATVKATEESAKEPKSQEKEIDKPQKTEEISSTDNGTQDSQPEQNMKLYLIIIGIVVLFVVICIILVIRKRKKKDNVKNVELNNNEDGGEK